MQDFDGCYGFESKRCHPRLRPRGLAEDDNVLGSVMNIDNQGLMNHV